jgi:hypothetical protein
MNVSVSDNTMPTMNRSISSGDHSLLGFIFFTRIYQPLSAVAHRNAARLLAEFILPVRGILAVVPIAVFAAHEGQSREG